MQDRRCASIATADCSVRHNNDRFFESAFTCSRNLSHRCHRTRIRVLRHSLWRYTYRFFSVLCAIHRVHFRSESNEYDHYLIVIRDLGRATNGTAAIWPSSLSVALGSERCFSTHILFSIKRFHYTKLVLHCITLYHAFRSLSSFHPPIIGIADLFFRIFKWKRDFNQG